MNNQGIFHLRLAGHVACKSRNAIMALDALEFVTIVARKCKRCEAQRAKMQAAQAKRQARLDREYAAKLAGVQLSPKHARKVTILGRCPECGVARRPGRPKHNCKAALRHVQRS